MSFKQSKSDKNESRYRKPGRGVRSGSSSQQRIFTGGRGRGGGGSTAPPLITNASSVSSTHSLKKIHNAQGVQSRVVVGSVNAASAAPTPVHNAVTYKPSDMATQRNTAPIPRASQSSTLTPYATTTPTTPAKGTFSHSTMPQLASSSNIDGGD